MRYDQLFVTIVSFLVCFLCFSCRWSQAEDLNRASLQDAADQVFVVIMLEYTTWPGDLEGQMELVRDLQEHALQGPLSEGFTLVHRFATVPAVSGWITPAAYMGAKKNSVLKDGDRIIRALDPDVSGRAYQEESRQKDGGSGGLASSVALIGADTLHAEGITGNGVEVAVLDSGIDRDHPDLQSALLAEQCFCFHPDGGCCPDGTSYQTGSGSAEDDHGHGTHVSGIIASRGSVSSAGVAPDAGITMVKILDGSNSFYSTSDIVSALDWLNVNRPDLDVVNMSLYTDTIFSDTCDSTYAWTQALYRAVANLTAKNVFVAAVAGNNGLAGMTTAPGCLSNVVSVGATDGNDTVAAFSNSHASVNYFAPGVHIVSDAVGGGTVAMSGTSMAVPHVAGAGALLRQAYPTISRAAIIEALSVTGVKVTDWNDLTRPRIDVHAAFSSLIEPASEGTIGPAILHLLLTQE